MKKTITLFLLSLFVNQEINAQSYVPVATTGYTHDAIAENTTAISTTSGPLDGVYVLYSAAYAALISSPYGLPNNGTLSSGTRTFQLQNYTAPNLLFVQPASQDSLTFITPAAYQNLSLLDFATDAFSPTTMSVTVRFTDNTTQVFSGITVYDWLYTGQTSFAGGFDRLNRSAGSAANEGGLGNPRFFTTDLAISCSNQSKLVKRIIIKNTGTLSEKLGILAVSGEATPLTAIASPNNLCNTGGAATLTAGGGASTFTWLPAGSFAGSTTSTISVTPTVTTEYTVQALSALNCLFNAMVTVNVHTTVPTLTVASTANAGGICPTETINLTASGATTYTWSGGAVTITNGVSFAPTTSGDYTVTGENACGTVTAVTSVSIHSSPTATLVASSPSLCSGNSVTLTATGDGTLYTWSNGITDGVGFSPTVTATYTVIGTSALSCTASATIPVTVVNTPSLAPTAQPALVCVGGSSTLTATGAASYTWTDGSTTANTSTFITTPTGTGITTYTVMRANSTCTTTQQISVVTNSLPTLFAIVAPTLVCALNPATLAVGGGQTYTWTSPGNPPSVPSFSFTGPSPVVYPPVPTTYTVAASDGTCINTTTVALATDPNPTITTLPTAPMICSGQSVGITANGGINYTWTATSGTFYTQSITDVPAISTSYNIQGDNSFGCITSANQVIVVNPNPTVTAVASKTLVCSTGPTTLTASGANTYVWDNSAITNTTIVNPVNTTSGPVVFSVTGTYSATGCHSTKTVQVTVFIPTLTVSGNTNTCAGGLISLTAGGGTGNSYSWLVPGNPPYGFSTLNTTVSAPAVFTVTAMTTSLTVSCPGTKTVDISIYSNPTITATPERTAICTKELVVLTATGGVTYLWSNNAGGETITVNPGTTTNYTVTGTDANGCVSTGTVQVKVLGCAGIGESSLVNSGLSIYPNPNNGEFYIQANTDLNLTLVNELGQLVRAVTLSGSNDYKISVNDLAKGIYFISGQKDGIHINQKIVVAK